MPMVKVWNVTDDANSDAKPQVRMVLGKSVKPGRAVRVEESRLINAHKLHKDVNAGLLSIGPRPPASYQQMKKPPRAVADARRVGEDGRIDPSEAKPEVRPGHNRPDPMLQGPPKAEEKSDKPMRAVDIKSVSEESAPEEEKPSEEESPPEESSEKGPRRRRR